MAHTSESTADTSSQISDVEFTPPTIEPFDIDCVPGDRRYQDSTSNREDQRDPLDSHNNSSDVQIVDDCNATKDESKCDVPTSSKPEPAPVHDPLDSHNDSSDVQIVEDVNVSNDKRMCDLSTSTKPEPATSFHASIHDAGDDPSFKVEDVISSTRSSLSAVVSQHDSFKVDGMLASLVGESGLCASATQEHDVKSEDEK